MSTKYETFTYTPVELAENMTNTVHDTLTYLYNNRYLNEADFEYLSSTMAVYAMPNRPGFGKRLLSRFFGGHEDENAFIFPIIEVDPQKNYRRDETTDKTKLNVVKGKFGKDKQDE